MVNLTLITTSRPELLRKAYAYFLGANDPYKALRVYVSRLKSTGRLRASTLARGRVHLPAVADKAGKYPSAAMRP